MTEKKCATCRYYIPVNEDGICEYPLPQLPFSFSGISERVWEGVANCPTWESGDGWQKMRNLYRKIRPDKQLSNMGIC